MFDFLPQGTFDIELSHETLSSSAPVSIAYPKGGSDVGLVVVPDVFGLRPLVDETISQIASIGICIIAVEQFSHIFENPSEVSREEKFSRINEMDDTIQCADILAAAQILRTQHSCTHVVLIGFCIGGMYAFKCAGTGLFDAVVSCYGMITLPEKWKGPKQREPMHYVSQESASRVLAIVGGQDHGYAQSDDVELLKKILGSDEHRAKGSRVIEFPDAGHAFMHDPQREEHRPGDAKQAWDVVFRFLLT